MQVSDSHHHMFQFHLSTQCHAAGRLKALENVTMGDRTYSSVHSGLCFHWQIWHPFCNPARCTADGGVVIYMHNIYIYSVQSLRLVFMCSVIHKMCACIMHVCVCVCACVCVSIVCVHACLGLSLCACAVKGMVGGRSMHCYTCIQLQVWGVPHWDSSVVRMPDLWSNGHGFESQQEWQKKFLLWGQHFVLTLILVLDLPQCY